MKENMASVASTAVTLRISGDSLDPEEVTRLLGAEPSMAAKRGGTIHTPKDTPSTARTGFWNLRIDWRMPGDFDAQIMKLLAGLSQDLAIWGNLADRFQLELFCGMIMEEPNEGTGLRAATILAMAQRGLSFELDVYGPAGADDDG